MKERWFVLTPDNLFYYDGKTKGAKKKGSICINKAVIIEPLFDMKSNRFRFLLNCGIKGVNYEIEALDLKSMNEWISAIQLCIDHSKDKTPLMRNLLERARERKERRRKKAEEDQLRIEHEALIQHQIQELQLLKEAALAQSAVEAALLEEEKKRVEELELMKLEYEKLLEEERLARLSESEARANQQSILEEEMFKRQTLEKIKIEQENILNEERKIRESLEEMSKEQAIILEEERQRLKVLDAARQAAEDELKSAHLKLKEAEEERHLASLKVELAKEKTRKINLPVGLAKPLVVEQRGIVTHRGLGAFVEDDFSKKPLYLSKEQSPAAVNKINIDEEQRTEIVESNLLKPSESKEIFK